MIQVRRHGESGPVVIVLHGGPGAPGSAAELARGLADRFRVLEPWQRGSGDGPLTVARHVADLHEVVEAVRGPGRPALVGESWGAMLALAYAAAHPQTVGPLALVGCGTFDEAARAQLRRTRERRIEAYLREHPDRGGEDPTEADARFLKWHEVTDYFERLEGLEAEAALFDERACRETWEDMMRCQGEGLYPAALGAIRSPAVMLHGAYDPHPGRMIHEGLLRYLPQLEYREQERCGHTPWQERYARDDFFVSLKAWLMLHIGGG